MSTDIISSFSDVEDTATSNSAEINFDFVEVLDSEYEQLHSKLQMLSNLSFGYKGASALPVDLNEDGLLLMYPLGVDSGWAYKVAHLRSQDDITEYQADSAYMHGGTHGIFQKIVPEGTTNRPRERITEGSEDYINLFKLLQRAVESPEYEDYINEALDLQTEKLIRKMQRRETIFRIFSSF